MRHTQAQRALRRARARNFAVAVLPLAALLSVAACTGDEPTPFQPLPVVPRDTVGPVVTLAPVPPIISAASVTITGTATDPRGIWRVVSKLTQSCCGGPVDADIVRGTTVSFSITHALGDGPFAIEVTAIDSAGNHTTVTATLLNDRGAPQLRVYAPTVTPHDTASLVIMGGDAHARELSLWYTTSGGDSVALAPLSGAPPAGSWTSAATRVVAVPGDVADLVVHAADDAGNRATRAVRIRRRAAIAELAPGSDHWCVLDAEGVAWCAGANEWGQLGRGATSGPDAELAPVATALRFTAIASGGFRSCALAQDGSMWCWGGEYPMLYQPQAHSPTPTRVESPVAFRSVHLGGGFTCGLGVDDRAYCWGRNAHGQLGDAWNADRNVPDTVATAQRFVQLTTSAWAAHACGLTADQRAFCWGSNEANQLGGENHVPGTQVSPPAAYMPIAAAPSHRFVSLQSGSQQVCGITPARDAICWGQSDAGRLGIGSTGPANPTRVNLPGQVRQLWTQAEHSCGVLLTGEAYCWGMGWDDQLAGLEGAYWVSPYPMRSMQGARFVKVATSTRGTCGLTGGGALYCWGREVPGAGR